MADVISVSELNHYVKTLLDVNDGLFDLALRGEIAAEEAFGKNTEVNPGGFTVLVEDNHPEHVGYFSVY